LKWMNSFKCFDFLFQVLWHSLSLSFWQIHKFNSWWSCVVIPKGKKNTNDYLKSCLQLNTILTFFLSFVSNAIIW
jgi:hypothetical protein